MDALQLKTILRCLATVIGLLGLASPTTSWADAGDDQYSVAASHYSAQRWELAEQEFDQLVRDHPQHRRAADALFFGGEALMQLRRYSEAARSFDQLLTRDSEHRYARQAEFRRAEANHLAGDWPTAATRLEGFLDRYKEDSLAAYALPYLAATKLKLDDRAAAESLYEQSTSRFPKGPMAAESWLRLGVLRYERGQFQASLAALRSSENHRSGRPFAAQSKYWQGMAHAGLREWTQATAKFDEAISAEPGGPWVDNCLAGKIRGAAAVNDLETLQSQASVLRERYPKSNLIVEIDALEIRVLLNHKRYPQVIEILEPRVATTGAQSPATVREMRFQLAMAYTAAGRQQAALEQFDLLDGQLKGKLRGDALMAEAAIHVDQGNHSLAVKLLEAYAEEFSDGPHAARCLGQLSICLLKTEHRKRALEHYETLERDYSEQPLFLATTQELAEMSLREGDASWARSLFERLAQDGNPAKYVARGIAGRAWCESLGEDLEASARSFQRLLDEYPNDPLAVEAALARARLLQRMQRNEKALETYQLITTRYDNHESASLARLRTAQLLDELGQKDQAVEVYEKLIAEKPHSREIAEARYGLAWLYMGRQESAASVEQFQVLQLEHRTSKFWSDATYRLAQRAFENKEYAEAARLAEELSTVEEDQEMLGRALYIQGQIAVAEGNWSEVDAPLSRLLTEAATSRVRLPAEYWLAEASYRRGEFELAKSRFDTLAKKIDGRDDAWLGMVPLRRAQLRAQLKQWNEAAQIANSIANDHPNFAQQYEADYLLGRCFAAQANFNEARKAYRKVTTAPAGKGGRTETAAMAQWMIGESFLHQKDYESAIRAYLRVPPLYAYPRWQAAALLQAGKCHEYKTEWGRAVQLYQRIQDEFPDTMFADQVAKRLQIARQRSAAPAR